jgi:hypothetical protein
MERAVKFLAHENKTRPNQLNTVRYLAGAQCGRSAPTVILAGARATRFKLCLLRNLATTQNEPAHMPRPRPGHSFPRITNRSEGDRCDKRAACDAFARSLAKLMRMADILGISQ